MKKFLCLLLVLCISAVFSATCVLADHAVESSAAPASLEDNLFPSYLAANYMIWAELLGVKDLSEDIDTSSDENRIVLSVDTLSVLCDKSTFDFDRAVLIYKHPGYSDIDMDLRALAFFAAVEYGKPAGLSDSEIRSVRSASLKLLDGMKQTIKDKSANVTNGEIVPFSVRSSVIYSFFQPSADMQAIIVD